MCVMSRRKNISHGCLENSWKFISVDRLSMLLETTVFRKFLIIDGRSSLEFKLRHITEAINLNCSKVSQQRLKSKKFSIWKLLGLSTSSNLCSYFDVIVYDQSTDDSKHLLPDECLALLLRTLSEYFQTVFLLKGGFQKFHSMHPSLCSSSKIRRSPSSVVVLDHSIPHSSHHISISQPCLPVSNLGPTKILPHLFLGSQTDAHSQETMSQNGITHVLNVSVSSPRPAFIQDGHFLRIPVNDSYSDKLSPFFQEAFQFLDKVREANGCALVHCLAGVSRSPTLAIAYIMYKLNLTMDEAYRYVKDKRPSISPNFNFLGQLLEYEKQLNCREPDENGYPDEAALSKKQCLENLSHLSPTDHIHNSKVLNFAPALTNFQATLTSPTTALAKLNFSHLSPLREQPSPLREDLHLDIPSASNTSATSNVTVVLGPKHNHVPTKRPLSGPVKGSTGFDENGHEYMKRPLVRPNSITFASGMSTGTTRKVGLIVSCYSRDKAFDGTKREDSQASILASSVVSKDSIVLKDGTLNSSEAVVENKESLLHGFKAVSDSCRTSWLTNMNEKLTVASGHDFSKTKSISRPADLILSPVNLTSQSENITQPKGTLVPDQSVWTKPSENKPSKSTALEPCNLTKLMGPLTKNTTQHTVTSWPTDLAIAVVNKSDESSQAMSMVRKSRSLEDILGGPVPCEFGSTSEQQQRFLSNYQKCSSYVINVLASPVTIGLDKHLFRCQASSSDSFQSPSSNDSLEMIPVS